ncbi:putative MFS nicotinic acid transporter Tna1 [Ramaria rubella]|nr:putative MFS nicotinic acid transporter Tna1 [Ramaria rubella]
MTSAEERRLLRRIDLRIVPYASLLYLLSFLDRVNIGQARLAGLEKDLRLRGNQYDVALTIFFVSYVAFELPSNLLLKRFKPQRWICFIMVCWSILQIAMGLVTNHQGLYATRFLLGLFESGLFPGLNFLFTTWYTRNELNFRVSIFLAGATLAGAFGGILAFGIRHMAGVGGKDGWAWIFILEGLLTLVCSIPALWLVQDFPQYSTLLTPKERTKWLHRLTASQGVTNSPLPFTKAQVLRALTDWKTYVYSVIYLSIGQPFYSLALFVPSIIAALGFTNANANLLSAAPYALGTVTTLTVAYISDRYSIRAPIIIVMMLFTIIGYIILLCNVSAAVKYVAVFITVAGVTPAGATAITFVGNNFGPMYTRAAVMGIFFSIGNSAGIISSNVYPAGDAPRYIRGHAIALGFSCLAIVLCAFMIYYNMRENARRDRRYGVPNPDGSDCSPMNADDPVRLKKWGLEGKSKQEIIELGDLHPAFRYVI